MRGDEGERVGVLVLRAWVTSDGKLRARITATPDILRGPVQECLSASAEDAVEVVRAWLADLREPRFPEGVTPP